MIYPQGYRQQRAFYHVRQIELNYLGKWWFIYIMAPVNSHFNANEEILQECIFLACLKAIYGLLSWWE